MPRIVGLPPTTEDLADDDLFPIHNTSTGDTEKSTLTKLKEYLQALVGWITTPMIADSAVTSRKSALTIVGASGVDQNPVSTTIGDIASSSVTFSVDVDSYILVTVSAWMQTNSTAFLDIYLNVDGTDEAKTLHQQGTVSGTTTDRKTNARTYKIALTAGSHTIKLRTKANASNSCVFQDATWYGLIVSQ